MLARLKVPLIAAALLAATAIFFPASKSERETAFYFWKTRWENSQTLNSALKANGAGVLYTRFFDVTWNSGPVPNAPLTSSSGFPSNLNVIPVIYLTNEVFLNLTSTAEAKVLAEKVWLKTKAMAKGWNLYLKEIQLDCDWTDSSRVRFFEFADRLHTFTKAAGLNLSATIRLHQVKYSARTGIPPVDRGMLMFYNMGRLAADSDRSSIFNSEDAGKYLDGLSSYPLPLDLALPIFSWLVHSRGGRILSLVEDVDPKELQSDPAGFHQDGEHGFTVLESRFFRGQYFKTGDRLLIDEPESVLKAAEMVHKAAGHGKFRTVAFFDLDEKAVKKYAFNDLRAILRVFN